MRRVSYQQPLAGLRQSQINPLRSFECQRPCLLCGACRLVHTCAL